MGTEIEAQTNEEVIQVRSRELQLENTEKLEEIIPVVQSIDEVNLQNMESNITQTKHMIINNIDNQTNLDDLASELKKISKNITEIKKSNTRLSKEIKELNQKIDKYIGDMND